MDEITKAEAELVKVVKQWLGGYIKVGNALEELKLLHQDNPKWGYGPFVVKTFGITYNRAHQLIHAAGFARIITDAGLTAPANEAVSYRLYRLADTPNIGQAKTLELWKEILAQTKKPTVPIVNAAVAKKWPADKPSSTITANDWLRRAEKALREAVDLLAKSPVGEIAMGDIRNLVSELMVRTETKS